MQPVRNMAAAFLQTWDKRCHVGTEKNINIQKNDHNNKQCIPNAPTCFYKTDGSINFVLHSWADLTHSCFYSVHAGLLHVSIIHWTLTWATQSLKCDCVLFACVLFTQGTSPKECLSSLQRIWLWTNLGAMHIIKTWNTESPKPVNLFGKTCKPASVSVTAYYCTKGSGNAASACVNLQCQLVPHPGNSLLDFIEPSKSLM